MEGTYRLEMPPPPTASSDIGCINELNRSASEASSSSTDKCDHVLRSSANLKWDDNTPWTNEKHSIYLQNLEASFVKQLHQSMNLIAQSSEQSKRDRNISYKQYGGRKADHKRSNFLSRYSADSHNTENIGKSIASYGVQTCSQQHSARCQEQMQEGSGQNFVDEEIQDESNSGPRVKRPKRGLADT